MPHPDGPLHSLTVKGRRVLVRIPADVLTDPDRRQAADAIRIRTLETDNANAVRYQTELELVVEQLTSRLRDKDHELEIKGAAGRDEAARHDAEVRRLRASLEDAAAQVAQERLWSAELEEALSDTERERDRYWQELEATREELSGYKESAAHSSEAVESLQSRDLHRISTIQKLRGAVNDLKQENRRLDSLLYPYKSKLQVAQRETRDARKVGGWMGLAGVGVGITVLVSSLSLYLLLSAPAAVIIGSYRPW